MESTPITDWLGHGLMMKLHGLKLAIREWNNSYHRETVTLLDLVTQLSQLDNLEGIVCLNEDQINRRRLLREQIENLTIQDHIHWQQRCKLKAS